MIEFTESDGIYAVLKNMAATGGEYAAALEKRAAHIYDAAQLARRELLETYGDAPVLELLFSNDDARAEIIASVPRTNKPEIAPSSDFIGGTVGRELDKFDMFCFCKALSAGERYTPGEMMAFLFELDGDAVGKNKKIAMLRNSSSSRAFELFAAHVRGVEATYGDNFKSVCDAVYLKDAGYAVLPLESSTDGRLDGLYMMIEKYDLAVLMSCMVLSGDGSATRFALVGRPQDVGDEVGRKKFEFKISLDEPSEISEISDAALFFGARFERVDTLPVSYGRDNAYGVIVDIDGADIAGFMTYMEMRFSQFVTVGIYSHITEE